MAGTIHKADGTILHIADSSSEATTLIAAQKAKTTTATLWADAVYTDVILPPPGAHLPHYEVKAGKVVHRNPESELAALCRPAWQYLHNLLQETKYHAALINAAADRRKVHNAAASLYKGFYAASVKTANLTGLTDERLKKFFELVQMGPMGVTDAYQFMRQLVSANVNIAASVYVDWRDAGSRVTVPNIVSTSQAVNVQAFSLPADVNILSGAWIDDVE